MIKPAFCICKNKDADQLCSNFTAGQRLCFQYINSTIPLLPESKISSLQPSSVVVQPGLCRIWSETPRTHFLTTQLICLMHMFDTMPQFLMHLFLVSLESHVHVLKSFNKHDR